MAECDLPTALERKKVTTWPCVLISFLFPYVLIFQTYQILYFFFLKIIFFLFLWLHPQNMEVPGPRIESECPRWGIEPAPLQWPSRRRWILNLLHHSGNVQILPFRGSVPFEHWRFPRTEPLQGLGTPALAIVVTLCWLLPESTGRRETGLGTQCPDQALRGADSWERGGPRLRR